MAKRKRKNQLNKEINLLKKPKLEENDVEKCGECKQLVKNVIIYKNPPKNATDELIALTNENLSLFTGNEKNIDENDQLPTHKVTNFTIYDKHNHLCFFDSDLIEQGTNLYISGYIKPIYDENKSLKNGIPVHKMGPINEWYIAGFDGGKNAIAGLITAYAQYILVKPSIEYKPFTIQFEKKIKLVKIVIEFLLNNSWKNPSFEDLLSHIKSFRIDEDFLLEHAQFICDQIYSFDKAGTEDDLPMIHISCVEYLVSLTGITFYERKKLVQVDFNTSKSNKNCLKSVSTPLVQAIFESFFVDQTNTDGLVTKDANKDNNCLFNIGNDAENSKQSFKNVSLVKYPLFISDNDRIIYKSAIIGELEIERDDFVVLLGDNNTKLIGNVIYIFKKGKELKIHLKMLYHSSETILGETGDRQELFSVDKCEDFPINQVFKKVNVCFKPVSKDWFQQGGKKPPILAKIGEEFFYTKEYDLETASFRDFLPEKSINECIYCKKRKLVENEQIPTLDSGGVINWLGEKYKIGSAVYLDSSIYSLPERALDNNEPLQKVDENIYPEYFRKTVQVKGSNTNTPNPFLIGKIENIFNEKPILIKVRLFLRPENTKHSIFLSHRSDLNLVYYTDEFLTIEFDKNVKGKCYLIQNDRNWTEHGPHRFYFNQFYNVGNNEFGEIPAAILLEDKQSAPIWPQIQSPLKCFDVFAGCGGLSLGLHQAGIAETLWAIEKEPTAAKAFELNNPNCKVFTDDCNLILSKIITENCKNLPKKGEVDLLVGGPPCQGFSAMNQFNSGQYSQFKNSLVVSFLSYCEYFRPKYFVLENVRNFTTYKKSMILKLTIRCLLTIGYQIRMGILQAGHFGVPQTRRRLILIATAPGWVLPDLPEPQHVFNPSACCLSIVLDGKRFVNGQKWVNSAPYRTICVRDAISDLPDVSTNCQEYEKAVSHYQKQMRAKNNDILTDHVCKKMALIVQARIAHIPTIPGSDWRDLPNISVELSNGTKTQILKYPYKITKNKKIIKGVCRCILGKKCSDRQTNTLIPWCLPHTADRHNNWAGLYGRLEWDGYFWTTITNPEPMGKQGRVLHPEQNRVVSVRECARSQGFPDHFRFFGNVMDKHRQVGNAVPPPLAKAIGIEIKKAVARTELLL